MKRLNKAHYFLSTLLIAMCFALTGAGFIQTLFPELEENTEEVFEAFDLKNEQTLSRLNKSPLFEDLRQSISKSIDERKEENKISDVSYTSNWAYNFYNDDKNPKGLFRRVNKSLYKRLKKENKLDEVPWRTVVDLDLFISNNTFPKEMTAPSSGSWSCLRDDETREYIKCMVGFSQSGGDRSVYYEFDFNSLSWVEDSAFKYEILGRTSLGWVDENQLLVNLDGFTYYNAKNPDQQVSYEDAISQGMITPAGYPRKTYLWKRGENFNLENLIFEASAKALYAGASAITMKNQPKDKIFGFFEYLSPTHSTVSFGMKKDNGGYTKHLIKLPFDYDKLSIITDDEQTISLYFGTKSEWQNLNKNDLAVKRVKFEENGDVVSNAHTKIYSMPEEEGLISFVSVIENVKFEKGDDQIIIGRSYNVSDSLIVLNRDGQNWKPKDLVDPLNLKYKSMRAWKDKEDGSLHMSITNFLNPRHEYILKPKGGGFEYELLKADKVKFDSSKYKIEQLWVDQGLDQNGKHIKVPYFIVYNPNKVNLNDSSQRSSPTLIYAYGGFEVSQKPYYLGGQGERWLDKGGVYVVANIRGGGEFGSYWHQSAIKKNRVNTYNDFFAISEDLIRRGITSSQKLAIEGGSNGGLLTGVAITQRPDLYKAAIISVPLLDMMRYHKLYVGSSWMTEYGDPDGEERDFWLKYSPLHSLEKSKDYPKAYITTNRYDDRVHPGHARKFAARLDELKKDYYYYENPNGGHGGDSLTSYEEALPHAIRYMYLYTELGMLE